MAGDSDIVRGRLARIGVPTGRGGHVLDAETAERLRSVAVAGHEIEVAVPCAVGSGSPDAPQTVRRRDDGAAVRAVDDGCGATAVVAVGEGEEETADALVHRSAVRPCGPGIQRVRGKRVRIVRRVVVLGHGGDLGDQSACQLHPCGGPVGIDPAAFLFGCGAGMRRYGLRFRGEGRGRQQHCPRGRGRTQQEGSRSGEFAGECSMCG